MSDSGMPVVLALLFLAGSPAELVSAPADISIRPSEPPPANKRRTIDRWQVLYTAEMAPVYRSWSAIVTVIHDRRLD